MLELVPSFLSSPPPSALLQPKNPPVKKRETEETPLPGIIDGDIFSDTLPFSPLKTILKIKEWIANNRASPVRKEDYLGVEASILESLKPHGWMTVAT